MNHFMSPPSLSLIVPYKYTPLQVPQRGPYGDTHLQQFPFLQSPCKETPSKFPKEFPMERNNPSPESMVTPLMSTGVPDTEALLENGEKRKFPFHETPRGQKAYIEWGGACSPRGSLTTLLSLSQCYAAYGILACVDQRPVSQYV
jgi:hypothetical protein